MQHVNVQDNQNALYKKTNTPQSHCVAIVPNIYLLFKYICIKFNLDQYTLKTKYQNSGYCTSHYGQLFGITPFGSEQRGQ